MILGFDATTLRGRLSGVGYYTARLMESLANGAGRGIVDRIVVLSNREVPVTPGDRVQVYTRRRSANGLPRKSAEVACVRPSDRLQFALCCRREWTR